MKKINLQGKANNCVALIAAACLCFAGLPANAFADTMTTANVSTVFSVDGMSFSVIDDSNVDLKQVSDREGALDIPSTVTYEGATYTVSMMERSALERCKSVTSVHIPASLEIKDSLQTTLQGNNLGLDSVESFQVDADNPYLCSEGGVLYNKSMTALMCYPRCKTDEHFDVPATVNTVCDYAFARNKYLTSVSFTGDLKGTSGDKLMYTGGIGSFAFDGCTALNSVEFADGMEICTHESKRRAAVGNYAFRGCTSLKSIVLPALTSALRKGDFYNAYGTKVGEYTSGYMGYWHNAEGPVQRTGVGDCAFYGCTSLETVVFLEGNSEGMFSYFYSGSNGNSTTVQDYVFTGCSSLKSLVFQDTLPYFVNENTSMMNQRYIDWWHANSLDDNGASIYCAVDYYGSEEDAQNESGMLVRAEYKTGTSVDAIANNTVDAGQLFEEVEIPDAATAAGHAGETGWCWHLSGNQYERSSLLDSCKAYPVKVSDFSEAHMSATQLDNVRIITDRHMSEEFDPYRYWYDRTSSLYESIFAYDQVYFGTKGACWFTLDSDGVHLDGLKLIAADGTEISSDNYTASYQAYNSSTNSTYPVTEIKATGPYLLTLTPTEESGYDTSQTVSQWILVRAHSADVSTHYANNYNASWTSYYANEAEGFSSAYAYGAHYAVVAGAGDATSGLIAAGLAGRVQGGIQVTASASALGMGMINSALSNVKSGYVIAIGNSAIGTAVDTKFKSTYGVRYKRYGASTGTYSASTIANRVYQKSIDEDESATFGTDGSWGDTAIICSPVNTGQVESISAYAYAKHAPVFFTEEDGSIAKSTWTCLKDFAHIVIAGDASLVSDETKTDMESYISEKGYAADVTRLEAAAGDACGFSIAVAKALLEDESLSVTATNVSICDGRDMMNAVGALNYTGYKQGITLVSESVGDSKRILDFLWDYRDKTDKVEVYSKDDAAISSNGFDLVSDISKLWDTDFIIEDLDKLCALKTGDTFTVNGGVFQITSAGKVTFTGTCYRDAVAVAPGDNVTYSEQNFTVTQVNLSGAAVTLAKTKMTYTGSLLKPGVTVKLNGKKLTQGTDFTVAYSNNRNVGTAKVTITGKNSYYGSVTAKFTVAKASQTIKAKTATKKFRYSAVKKKVRRFKIGASAKTKLKYSVTAKVKKAGVSVNAYGKVTVKKGTKKGKYSIKITAIGTANYLSASKTITVKIY